MDVDNYEFDADDRYMVELGYSRAPSEILALLKKEKPITLKFLDGYETCSSFKFGKLLGEGKVGSVYEIEEDNHKGLPVVLKEFTIKDTHKILKNSSARGKNNPDTIYVLSSAFNDVVMSSLFHSFYDGPSKFSITFPYYEGFFSCDSTGYSIIEKLDMTFSKYCASDAFHPEVFRVLLFQGLYSTRFMKQNNVVHNDMHAKNVMIRHTKGISYKGTRLDDVKNLSYKDGHKYYSHRNMGIIGKVVDFDFAAKYSEPGVVAQKVYTKRDDEWNLQYRFSESYDVMTFVAYMIFYTTIRNPGNGKLSGDDLQKTRSMVHNVAEYIVKEAERTVGPIKVLDHYNKESNGKQRSRDAVSKLMDMVSVPQYRPYEKYCHLDLDNILDIKAFKEFQGKRDNSLLVGSL
jgi:serine/threonine protein kinase